MAAITPSVSNVGNKRVPTIVSWVQINEDDTGDVHAITGEYMVGSIHFFGTFNGGTLSLQGSIDNTNWVTIKDTTGSAIEATAASTFNFACSYPYIRIANDAGGTTEDIDVSISYATPR